jgi:hypothetical protein
VIIKNLNFDGSYGDAATPPSSCNPRGAGDCNFWSDLWYDWPVKSVTLQDVAFYNATEQAVTIQGSNHVVRRVRVSHSRNAGLHIGSAIRVAVLSSTFTSNLGAGVAITGTGTDTITIGGKNLSNYFYHNHWGLPDGSPGGQIYVADAANVVIMNNFIDGQYSASDPARQAGIEVDPNTTVTLSGNTVHDNGAEGENFKFNASARVSNELVYSNRQYGFSFLGIAANHNRGTDPRVQLNNVKTTGNPVDIYVWGVLTARLVCSDNHLLTTLISRESDPNAYYTQGACP